jgi:hypothetical protein
VGGSGLVVSRAVVYKTASPSAMFGWWLTEEEEGLLRWREELEVERGEGLVR